MATDTWRRWSLTHADPHEHGPPVLRLPRPRPRLAPSPSTSLSQASPSPLPSVSFWSLLGTLGQLSQASPNESVSEFCWSLLGNSRQLSWCGGERVKSPLNPWVPSTPWSLYPCLQPLTGNGPPAWRSPAHPTSRWSTLSWPPAFCPPHGGYWGPSWRAAGGLGVHGTRRQVRNGMGVGGAGRRGHLDVLDPVPVGIVVTLVPHAVVIRIFLPGVGCQKAVVLRVGGGGGRVSRGQRWPGRPPCPAPARRHLLAVLVVVHAGQRLVRVAVDVRVGPAHVPVPGPAHVALGNAEAACQRSGLTPPSSPPPLRLQVRQPPPRPRPALLSLEAAASPPPPPDASSSSRAPGPTHQAGHCPIAFKEAVRVDVARAVGWAVAGPGRDAALALVAQEAQATGTTPERALSTRKQYSQEAGSACQAPRARTVPAEGSGWALGYVPGPCRSSGTCRLSPPGSPDSLSKRVRAPFAK